jgi:uncharacterized protein (DUF58 family)
MPPSAPERSPAASAGRARSTAPERVLRRLEWTVLRRLDGMLQGEYRTLFLGHGLELSDIREYEPGDDVRYIDWNVTARMDSPFVRQYQEDREVTAWFLLDLSPSVDFGTAKTLKRELVIDLVGLVARILTRRGNRVGAILYGRSVERVLPPRGGRAQVLQLLDLLMTRERPREAPLTTLAELLETALLTVKRRSVVFVVSDFISTPGWDRPLGMLARRHEVIAARLTDPRESTLPDIGLAVLRDAETGEHLWVDTGDRRFRERFDQFARRREEALRTAFRRASVDELNLSTEDDLASAVVRFATLRRLRRHRERAAGARAV